MGDDGSRSEQLESLLSVLDDIPEPLRSRNLPVDGYDFHTRVAEPSRSWVNALFKHIDRCGQLIRFPQEGEGLDSLWLRHLAGRLERFDEAIRTRGFDRALSAWCDDLGPIAEEYRGVAYQVNSLRSQHTPGRLRSILLNERPSLVDHLRRLAVEFEGRCIESNLPPRQGVGPMWITTPFTRAQDAQEETVRHFRDSVGELLLRMVDERSIPADLRTSPTLVNAAYDVLRGSGGLYAGRLCDALIQDWLPAVREDFGGPGFDYPGAEQDDQTRFNVGIRVARCVVALVDAIEPTPTRLDQPRTQASPRKQNAETFVTFSADAAVAKFGGGLGDNNRRQPAAPAMQTPAPEQVVSDAVPPDPQPAPPADQAPTGNSEPAHRRSGTVAWLICHLKNAESALEAIEKAGEAARQYSNGDQQYFNLRQRQHDLRGKRDGYLRAIREAPGAGKLIAWFDARRLEWTAASVRQQRGVLIIDCDYPDAEVDSMNLVEFLEALRGIPDPHFRPLPPQKPDTNESGNPVAPVASESKKDLAPADQRAWASWMLAKEHGQAEGTYREAYEWLKEEGCELFVDGLFGYKLPENPETWERQARRGKKFHGDHTNSPRAGRQHGSSIVNESDI